MEFEFPGLQSAIWWWEMEADKERKQKVALFGFMFLESSSPLYQAMDLTNKTY